MSTRTTTGGPGPNQTMDETWSPGETMHGTTILPHADVTRHDKKEQTTPKTCPEGGVQPGSLKTLLGYDNICFIIPWHLPVVGIEYTDLYSPIAFCTSATATYIYIQLNMA